MSKYTYPTDKPPTPQNSPFLANIGEGKRVLEIGCGLGFHTRAIRDHLKCRVTCIEIDAHAANSAREFCEQVFVGNIESANLYDWLDDDQFDVITFGDVLEHLRDPVETLSRVQPFLSANGYIVASIPNFTHASILFELSRGIFQYRPIGLLDDTHIRFFSRQTIYDTFEAAGYQVLSLDRRRVPPQDTEFETRPETFEDRQFLRYIFEHNPDADTYQFIVKSVPNHGTSDGTSHLVKATATIRELEIQSRMHQQRLMTTEEKLDRLRSRFLVRVAQAVERMLGRPPV